MSRVHYVSDPISHEHNDVTPTHFHSTGEPIYVTYLDPDDGQLRLRVYLVCKGGELNEFRYPKPKDDDDGL